MKRTSLIITVIITILGAGSIFLILSTCTTNTTSNTRSRIVADGGMYGDIAYATKSSAEKLDLSLPSQGKTDYPPVIYIHGGAFRFGDKAEPSDVLLIKQIVAQGYAVASVNYRLSTEAKSPAQVQDVKAAVRYLRTNATQYRINPNKFVAGGGSAGGYLAAMLGTTADVSSLDNAELGNAGVSSRVQAVVDWYGPINFLTMASEAKSLGISSATDSASSPESTLMGSAIQSIPDAVKAVNPTTYITSDDAAFFIQHGTADTTIPYTQSQNFASALTKVLGQNRVSFETLSGAKHGDPVFATSSNLQKVFAFLNQHL
jgi:acetyl esterase/lipase